VDPIDIGMVLVGIVVLVVGGELLVRGAATLAERLGMSPLVVGLTVVAFATSAPELAVTLGSVLRGQPDLAVGNVVGSNIANVLLIVGISAIILPLLVKVQLVRVDIPFMVALSILLFLLSLDGGISTFDGIALFVILGLYISIAIILGKRSGTDHAEDVKPTRSMPGASISTASAGRVTQSLDVAEPDPAGEDITMTEAMSEVADVEGPWWRDVLSVLAGVALLVIGANVLVEGATGIARGFGLSELIIGLTVVAIGTSLPELATSIAAVRRGQRDLAVGNVVGSNIFNIGAVMGLGAIFSPTGIPIPESAIALDLPLMIAASVALLPIAFTASRIDRWEGTLFFGLYIAYITYMVLAASERPLLQGFTTVMVWFVAPLVLLTLLTTAAYEAGRRRQAGHTLLDPIEEDLLDENEKT
jgi:cation:H+ antiporter